MSKELLSYKPLVDRYLNKIDSPLCAFSFVNLFVWQDFFKFDFFEIDGHLCVFASDSATTFLYLPPLAKEIKPSVADECFKKLKKSKGGRIENVSEQQLVFFPQEKYKIYKKGYEYLYFRKDLVELKGDAYKSKRHDANHCVKNYRCEYGAFESSMIVECMDLYERWAKHKKDSLTDEIHLAMIDDNRKVHRRALESFRELNLLGRIVKIDGKIAAYTFGYFLNNDTFCDLIEIADVEYKGLATYIFWQLCSEEVLKNTRFINVMDDFAPQNVNRTKMSFRPALMLPVYVVSYENRDS